MPPTKSSQTRKGIKRKTEKNMIIHIEDPFSGLKTQSVIGME